MTQGARPGRVPPQKGSSPGPPPAPWGSFPLSELVVLVALIFLIAGLFVEPPRGAVMIGTGLVLGSLAGLELSWREHFAGYRSHTMLLSGAVMIAVVAALFALDPGAIPPTARMVIGVVAFGLAAWGFLAIFRRRSGGEMFKVR